MRKLAFPAVVASFEDDGYCAILSFGDDTVSPRNYVILQSGNDPSPQDKALGIDGMFLECSAGFEGYDLVETISSADRGVVIGLKEGKIGLAEISISLSDACAAELARSRGLEIFRDRLARR